MRTLRLFAVGRFLAVTARRTGLLIFFLLMTLLLPNDTGYSAAAHPPASPIKAAITSASLRVRFFNGFIQKLGNSGGSESLCDTNYDLIFRLY